MRILHYTKTYTTHSCKGRDIDFYGLLQLQQFYDMQFYTNTPVSHCHNILCKNIHYYPKEAV